LFLGLGVPCRAGGGGIAPTPYPDAYRDSLPMCPLTLS
jgi:hypothetical protein